MMDGVESNQPRAYEGIRETLESIIVALILAFVFRAFVVEAFVIPTGSMAPTLYGAHGTILCDNCGVEFAYGLRDLSDHRQVQPVRRTHEAYCPECRHPNTDLTVTDARGNPESGDRILVLKWPYDLGVLGLGPARWDVTVFKDPADGTTNFIKRLVGLPNEVLMILDGDVFAADVADLSQRVVDQLEHLRHEKYMFRTGARSRRDRFPSVPKYVYDELDAKSHVVRKSNIVGRSLWHTVYDQDHPPKAAAEQMPRWISAADESSGWDVQQARIRFEDKGQNDDTGRPDDTGQPDDTARANDMGQTNDTGQENDTGLTNGKRQAVDTLELRGGAIRATCAYNLHGNAPRPLPVGAAQPPFVADQRVRFVLTPRTSEGVIGITLQKHKRRFHARISLDGNVSIVETGWRSPAEPVDISTKVAALRPDVPVRISFENLDYRLSLKIDGREVLATTDDAGQTGYYAANIKTLRLMRNTRSARPRLDASGGIFELTHLAVDRDIYYYHPSRRRLGLEWAPPGGWGSAQSPMLLRDHEYFMLGDNTAASKDSRLWDRIGPHLVARGEQCQLGAVPGDQLIGKAFYVYWPSMQRISWFDWVPMFKRWGIVPDVGRMRWIR